MKRNFNVESLKAIYNIKETPCAHPIIENGKVKQWIYFSICSVCGKEYVTYGESFKFCSDSCKKENDNWIKNVKEFKESDFYLDNFQPQI